LLIVLWGAYYEVFGLVYTILSANWTPMERLKEGEVSEYVLWGFVYGGLGVLLIRMADFIVRISYSDPSARPQRQLPGSDSRRQV